jgi:hypothetical protein
MTNEIEIVDDDDDAESADLLVCKRLTSPLLLPDNLVSLCSQCGEAIQHRPDVPVTPQKLCEVCALPIIEAETAKGTMVAMMTPKSMTELAAHIRKTKAH